MNFIEKALESYKAEETDFLMLKPGLKVTVIGEVVEHFIAQSSRIMTSITLTGENCHRDLCLVTYDWLPYGD